MSDIIARLDAEKKTAIQKLALQDAFLAGMKHRANDDLDFEAWYSKRLLLNSGK